MDENTIPQPYKITVKKRREQNGHNSFLIFFTGLSGSGKSTIANALEQRLFHEGIRTYVLDGDNIRRGINKELSFSPEDRSENIRRIGEISKLLVDAGTVVLAAFISPYNKDRVNIRETVGNDNYVEIFVNTSLDVCEKRDVKGLYKKARKGKIKNMTGISAPYEIPEEPDIEITEGNGVQESVEIVYSKIKKRLEL